MKRALPTIFFLAAAAIAPAADTASLAGKWKLHSNIQGYEGDLDCTLTQDGSQISGTCKGESGDVTLTGKLEDKKVTLQYKTNYNGDELTIVYTADVKSTEKFSGSVLVQPMNVDGEFTATPVK